MFLRGPNVQLVPYHPDNWGYIGRWFYDSDYREMWRHHPIAWGEQEFRNYPKLLNAQVFLIVKKGVEEPIGFIQMIPDCKTNRGFYVGILVDKSQRDFLITNEAFMLLFNYAFNRMGYRKAILEILSTRDKLKQRLLKEGFLNEGTHFGEAFINGEFVDEFRLSMSSVFFNKRHKETVESWDHS